MKTIHEIMNFAPQLTAIEHGPEPTLEDLLYNYYVERDIPPSSAQKLVKDYKAKMTEFLVS